MPRFLIHHRHLARECRAAFAAWKGFASPLRHSETISSCLSGGHEVWWETEAATEREALAQLPHYVAARATAVRVNEIEVP